MAAQLPGGMVGLRFCLLASELPRAQRQHLLAGAGLCHLFCVSGSCYLSPASTLKSHLALSSLKGWSPLALRVCAPPTPSNVSLSRGLCAGRGEGWGVDSQHSWALRFPRRPLSRLPPSHTLFLSGCFFLSRTLQGQTKADWQCLLPYPLHLGKLSRGEGFREFFVGVAACFLPQPGLELGGGGVPTVCPTVEMHSETPLAFPAPSEWLSSLCCRRGACACPPCPSQGHV